MSEHVTETWIRHFEREFFGEPPEDKSIYDPDVRKLVAAARDRNKRVDDARALLEDIRWLHHEVYAGDNPSGDKLWRLQEGLHRIAGIEWPSEDAIMEANFDD